MQRIGISITERELARLTALQRRLGARSRSELVRELIKRYDTLESRMGELAACLKGYAETPETGEADRRALLRGAMGKQPPEDWS